LVLEIDVVMSLSYPKFGTKYQLGDLCKLVSDESTIRTHQRQEEALLKVQNPKEYCQYFLDVEL